MKRLAILMILIFLGFSAMVIAQTEVRSVASGSWTGPNIGQTTTSQTWGNDQENVPTANSNVVITSGHTVTIPTWYSAKAAKVTIENGATLVVAGPLNYSGELNNSGILDVRHSGNLVGPGKIVNNGTIRFRETQPGNWNITVNSNIENSGIIKWEGCNIHSTKQGGVTWNCNGGGRLIRAARPNLSIRKSITIDGDCATVRSVASGSWTGPNVGQTTTSQTWGSDQDNALYFNGQNQYAEFTAPSNMPSGSAPRTIEFWMKSDLRRGAKDNHESIIELGEQAYNGSAFGIFTAISNGKTVLSFWGHNADKGNLAVIPDDQWHFVAITYNEPNIQCYIDGELKSTNSIVTAVGGQRLNTKIGKCYIGGFPDRGWYFKGAVDNVTIWNTVRSAAQIKQDMIPWPCRRSGDANLVAHFRLNESAGTSFKDISSKITGKLVGGNLWTKAIAIDPSPISYGIWFVIQNKSDVDNDLATPARRMALRTNGTATPTMAHIPLTGNYNEFLWRAIPLGGGRYKLVNKKLGMSRALDCSQTNPTIGVYGNYSGQIWNLSQANVSTMGTNVYTMTNTFITNSKALSFVNNQVIVTAKNSSDTKQAWVFQPMSLVAGYHIPKTDDGNCPTNKQLHAGAIEVYGTNTTSDWAMLNTHLIIKNMVNALEVSTAGLNDQRIYIITRYDYNPDFISQYPLVGIPSAWIGETRGGQHPGYNLTMVTEEMMCRNGVYSRRNNNPPDTQYREYDQVVHEFGHTIDVFCQQNGANTPGDCLSPSPKERYAASVQAWFNNNFGYGLPCQKNRANLRSNQKASYDYIDRAFNAKNTWMPPRKLREAYNPQ